MTLKRILVAAWRSFRRNGWLSTATILVMMLTLFVIGGLLLMSVVTNAVLTELERKIDIAVEFEQGTNENSILAAKREIETLADVEEVTYISADEALANFRERHQNDPDILASLEELGDENPLPATLNIKAKNARNFSGIAEFLQSKNYPGVCDTCINYFENQKVIDRLSEIVRSVRAFGAGTALLLAFIAVLVAFTTIRLAIYTAREEINIMKLVGATNWYIRGPFMVEGMLYGSIAALATAVLFFPIAWFASGKITALMPEVNLAEYFQTHFFEFTAILLALGIILGIVSSMIAVRRYLRV
ncbi:ABC transporter permease [Candidatus Parcubacteria bacterium]|nr:MAG: ABC transporter permease [Candidatus Parcubacteria bacterium]